MLRLFLQIAIPVVLTTLAIYFFTRKRSASKSSPNPGSVPPGPPTPAQERAVQARDAGPISVPAFLAIVAMGALFSLGLVAVLA